MQRYMVMHSAMESGMQAAAQILLAEAEDDLAQSKAKAKTMANANADSKRISSML